MSTVNNSSAEPERQESLRENNEAAISSAAVEKEKAQDRDPLIQEDVKTAGTGEGSTGDNNDGILPPEDIESGKGQQDQASPLLKEQPEQPEQITKGEVDGDTDMVKLSEDIYSLVYTAKTKSLAFAFAMATFIMQITILLLIFIDLVDMTDDPPLSPNGKPNRMKIPAGIETYVTVAQFFGVALTINFMAHGGDLLKGLRTLIRGYNEGILQIKPGATKFKWILAGVLQAFAGAMMTIDLFILMMQSTNVIGMCLNFAALYFVQDIDDVAFAVASLGLVSRRIQNECLSIGDLSVPATSKKLRNCITRAFMTCLWIGFYIGFAIIAYTQTRGQYRCTALFIQFGDQDFPEMPYFSGRFEVKYGAGNLPLQSNDRSIFWDASDTIRIRYSKGERAWIIERNIGADHPEYKGYMFKSSQTTTFDIAEVADQTWFAYKEGGDVAVDWLYMNCANCRPDRCTSEYGQCVDDRCVCNFGRTGQFCESTYSDCQHMGLDLRTTSEVRNIPGGQFFSQNEFQDLNVYTQEKLRFRFTFYERNIYIPYTFGVDPGEELIDNWIAFTGRRWIIFGFDPTSKGELNTTAFQSFLRLTQDSNATSRREGLQSFAQSSGYVPLFFSSPVDYGTPSYGYDPTSVTWYLAAPSNPRERAPEQTFPAGPNDDTPVPAKFLCSDCVESKTCRNGGQCNEEWGYCMCEPFYSGYQCEYSYSCSEVGCFNGGICDPFTGACKHCIPDASGALCQYPLPRKIAKNRFFCNITNGLLGPCHNGQLCNGIEQKCECEEPFYGELCELSTQANCSTVGPIWGNKTRPEVDACQNGGFCDWTLDYPICRCREPYAGDFCELDLSLNATG